MTTTPNRPRAITMVPLRRCGSHALRLRLNKSPEFYSPYPLHLCDFMPLVDQHYGDLSDDNLYFQLIRDVIGFQDALMVKWKDVNFDPVDIFNATKDVPNRSVHTIAWEMLSQAGEQHDASIVMDKSLDNIHYAAELIETRPDMLFLNVVRDPRAQVDSMNRAIIYDFDYLLNAQRWVAAFDKMREVAEQYPERVLTVRFEDFLSNQEVVLRKICEFMGIEFLDSMCDISDSSEARKLSHLSSLWESNFSAPIAANADKFRKNMTDDDIRMIESIAKDHMQHYGYEFMTDADLEITEEMVAAAEKRSAENKRAAWTTLKETQPRDFILRTFRADYINMVKERLENRPWKSAAQPLRAAS
ncbi:sulfotransferase [Endothiovibrio diazotrophicus]